MRKYELCSECHDLFEYSGNNEIERIWVKGGRPIRRDWFVFKTADDAIDFFTKVCGAIEGRDPPGVFREVLRRETLSKGIYCCLS